MILCIVWQAVFGISQYRAPCCGDYNRKHSGYSHRIEQLTSWDSAMPSLVRFLKLFILSFFFKLWDFYACIFHKEGGLFRGWPFTFGFHFYVFWPNDPKNWYCGCFKIPKFLHSTPKFFVLVLRNWSQILIIFMPYNCYHYNHCRDLLI